MVWFHLLSYDFNARDGIMSIRRPVPPEYDDKYRSRSYSVVERQKCDNFMTSSFPKTTEKVEYSGSIQKDNALSLALSLCLCPSVASGLAMANSIKFYDLSSAAFLDILPEMYTSR